jgi:hypothetical protein
LILRMPQELGRLSRFSRRRGAEEHAPFAAEFCLDQLES